MELKSADHIELILKIINTGTWAQDAIWENNKDDGDYVSVPLPDISYRSDGFLIIEQGRTELRSTGVKLYSNQEEMWQHFRKEFGHWPQFPLKKKDWKRLSRRKEANYLVRTFELFAHNIYATTYEKDREIENIKFYIRRGWDDVNDVRRDDLLIHSWSKTQ